MISVRPFHAPPKALQSLCFESLVNAIDWQNCWKYRFIFRCLPQGLLLKILVMMKKSQLPSPGQMDRFTNHYFCVCRLLQSTIWTRCNNIREVDLSSSSVENDWVKQLVKHMPRLTTLILTATACDNNLLQDISIYGGELKELHLEKCTKVTDMGVEYFASHHCSAGHDSSMLTLLNLRATGVTLTGVYYALWRLPELQYLFSAFTCSALYKLHVYLFEVNLRHLTNFDVDLDQLKTCLSVSKKINSLRLLQKERLPPHDCWAILQDLIQPLGRHLTTLKLHDFTLDASLLHQFCPNLEHLTLIRVLFISRRRRYSVLPVHSMAFPNQYLFDMGGSKLQKVVMHECAGLTDEVLTTLLDKAHTIQKLFVVGEPQCVLTDEAFRSIKKTNSLRCLTEVRLTKLPYLGADTLKILLPPKGFTHTVHISRDCEQLQLALTQDDIHKQRWLVKI